MPHFLTFLAVSINYFLVCFAVHGSSEAGVESGPSCNTDQSPAKDNGQNAVTPAGSTNPWSIARANKLPAHKVARITNTICRYIIDDLRPFSTVESQSFSDILKETEPRYDPDAIANRLISGMYQSIRNGVTQV